MEVSYKYKMNEDIPNIDYNKDEQELWTFLYRHLVPKIRECACDEHMKNFQQILDLGLFSEHKLPQQRELSEFL